MSVSNKYKHFAKIQDVYFKLYNYEFDHRPSCKDDGDERFTARTKIKKRLVTLIKNSKTTQGAYLVTGYRGIGKTSLVREVIKEVNETDKKATKEDEKIKEYETFEVGLSQDEVRDIDLLTDVTHRHTYPVEC